MYIFILIYLCLLLIYSKILNDIGENLKLFLEMLEKF